MRVNTAVIHCVQSFDIHYEFRISLRLFRAVNIYVVATGNALTVVNNTKRNTKKWPRQFQWQLSWHARNMIHSCSP